MRKQKRNSGKEYLDSTGSLTKARQMKTGCHNKCKRKCHSKISKENQSQLFDTFWDISEIQQQRQFVSQSLILTDVKRQTTGESSRRNKSLSYYLNIKDNRIQVCKKFFLNTFGISEKFIRNSLKMSEDGIVRQDNRGHHVTNAESVKKDFLREHIKSFPVMPSHYCRSHSNKQFLSSDLSIRKMYELYTLASKNMFGNDYIPLSEHTYRDVFNYEFNLAFNKPLKDQCDFCTTYSNLSDEEKQKQKTAFEKHVQNKIKIREIKESSKQKAKTSKNVSSACFDLEQVLELPHCDASSMYYSRKLCSFNLTAFDLADDDVACYMWTEIEGGRGASDIASCMFHFIEQKVTSGITEFELFSDKCSGQNRNKYFLTMLVYCMLTFSSIKSITHRFFESGHSQNENDSVHARIERAKKGLQIFVPEQYHMLVQTARRTKSPYRVIPMTKTMFYDFHLMATSLKNFSVDENGNKVEWLRINEFCIHKDHPYKVKFKYFHSDATYETLDLIRKQRGKPPQLKLSQMKRNCVISKAKFDDLMKLVRKNLIPKTYEAFYQKLPHSNE